MSSRFDRSMSRQFVTSDEVRSAASRSESHIAIPQNCTVTDEARELALKFSIRFGDAGTAKRAAVADSPAQRPNNTPAPDAAQQTWPEDTNRRAGRAKSGRAQSDATANDRSPSIRRTRSQSELR